MRQYLDLLKTIRDSGYDHDDRTGVGRRTILAPQMRFKMSDGFPLVTTRRINYKAMIDELLWFISGSLDAGDLNSKIWDNWKVKDSDILKMLKQVPDEEKKAVADHLEQYKDSVGPIYGPNWRNAPQPYINHMWPKIDLKDIPKDKLEFYKESYEQLSDEDKGSIEREEFIKLSYMMTNDQLNNLVVGLKKRPYSSRHIVTAWVPSNIPFEELSPQENVLLDKSALAPCHMMFQCFVRPNHAHVGKDKLSMILTIRSNDIPVGNPFNVAQYALLLHMLAQVSDLEADELIVNMGDAHIYKNQLEIIDTQLGRSPLPLPTLKLNPDIKSLYDFTIDDVEIEDYNPHARIDYPVAT